MSPSTCSQVFLRLLTSVLFATSIVQAATLPHQVLDTRAPIALSSELPTTSDIAAALDTFNSPEPGNVFEDVE
jgi:hypothetical protein